MVMVSSQVSEVQPSCGQQFLNDTIPATDYEHVEEDESEIVGGSCVSIAFAITNIDGVRDSTSIKIIEIFGMLGYVFSEL